MPKQILIIEDEEDIQELIRYNLTKEGYNVICAANGEDGLKFAKKENPDLMLLDLMLPGINGLDLCRTLKSDQALQHIPVIMVSARGEEADVVVGLEMGADDYVTKPFSNRILIARVRTILRRSVRDTNEKPDAISIEGLKIDRARHVFTIDDVPVELTATEFRILNFLADNSGRVFTRHQIVLGVHGDDYPVTDRSIDVQITGLRKKLLNYSEYLETVRGVGYRFKEQEA